MPMSMTMTIRSRFGPLALVMILLLTGSGVATGQPPTDTLSYQLVSAEVSRTPPRVGFVVVEFGKSMPARYLAAANQTLSPAPEWTILLRDLRSPATVTTVEVKAVVVPDAPAQDRLVVLQPATPVDPATHQIKVQLLQGNFPEVVVSQPRRQGASAFYGPARGKDDADIYFKGLVLATTDTSPAYSIDAKGAYYTKLGAKGGGLGAKATYAVDKASDIGPDSITANVAYSKVFVFAPATGLVLAADAFGFELDAKNETRNVRSSATGQFVFPSIQLGPKSFATADALVGYEAGHNSTNAVTANSLGSLWRTVLGGNGYLVLKGTPGIPRIDLTASWRVRLLGQDEPFTKRRNGANVTELSDSARHLVTVGGAFMVTEALGLSIAYRHGSEPPAYKYVGHRAELGVVFKLTQVNKG
jgi:hypothetical protein